MILMKLSNGKELREYSSFPFFFLHTWKSMGYSNEMIVSTC